MIFCPRCAKSGNSDDRFCGFCGYNLMVQNASDFVTKQSLKVKDIKFDLGLVYFKEGKYQKAFEIFEKIHQSDLSNIQATEMYERARDALKENTKTS